MIGAAARYLLTATIVLGLGAAQAADSCDLKRSIMFAGNDWAHGRGASVVERYVSIAGRISALVVGTPAIEMIFQGLEQWLVTNRIIGG